MPIFSIYNLDFISYQYHDCPKGECFKVFLDMAYISEIRYEIMLHVIMYRHSNRFQKPTF